MYVYIMNIMNERSIMTKSEYLVLSLMMIIGLGFIDILWMFGVENSKEYTWWYVLHMLGGLQ
jgi:exonuclease III